MTYWKPLPDGLASDVRQLVTELRTLKTRSGLSLAALAERTPYSKSSWERYLNGKTLPPRQAVTMLGELSDAEPARLAALWELANAATHDQQAEGGRPVQPAPRSEPPAARTEAAPPPSDEGRRRRRDVRLLWTAALLLVLVLVGAAVVLVHGDSSAGTAQAAISESGGRPADVNCFADSCAGKDPKEAGCGGGTRGPRP
ncbi:helix-turn-helix transcriptional regulator [Streptomyces rameus]|uniref:helix-turn-helix domain-containing protein n=1 Tax=Streptomyces rameus TaxID=68261 RepID=UPI0031E94A26